MKSDFTKSTMVGIAGALSLLTSACTTPGGQGIQPTLQVKSPLPSVINKRSIDPDNCMVTKTKGFDIGSILAFVPIIPIHSFQVSGATEFDKGCWAARTAEMLTDSSEDDFRALAVLMYEKFTPLQKLMVDKHLAAKGTSMEELQKTLPQQVRAVQDESGVAVFYKMPDQPFEAMHAFPLSSAQPARQPVAAPRP